MNRRSFLGSLAAAMVLDPEKLLWVPGRKAFSLPAAGYHVRVGQNGQSSFHYHRKRSGEWFEVEFAPSGGLAINAKPIGFRTPVEIERLAPSFNLGQEASFRFIASEDIKL